MNSKKKISVIILVVVLTVAIFACRKITVGFLSDGVYYSGSPFTINKGTPKFITGALNLDGSTLPATVSLLDIRKKGTTIKAEELFKEYDLYVYTRPYDPLLDTTIEQLNAIRKKIKSKPFSFLPSGQFYFNSASDFVPTGEYEFDVEVKNDNGSKIFTNIGLLNFKEQELYNLEGFGVAWFKDFTTQNGGLPTPVVTIKKIADTGTNCILKYTDKNGVAFNPLRNEIIKRGDRADFDSYTRFHPIKKTDTAQICNFELPPFPAVSTSFGHLIYYRIPSTFVKVDVEYLPAGTAANDFQFNVNPRIAFVINKPGTYLVEMKLLGVTHR